MDYCEWVSLMTSLLQTLHQQAGLAEAASVEDHTSLLTTGPIVAMCIGVIAFVAHSLGHYAGRRGRGQGSGSIIDDIEKKQKRS